MKQYISDCLEQVYSTAKTDKYGQIPKHNFSIDNIFKSNAKKVLYYLIDNEDVITVNKYGNKYSNYLAVNLILDKDIKERCQEAFKNNKHRKQNMNRSW